MARATNSTRPNPKNKPAPRQGRAANSTGGSSQWAEEMVRVQEAHATQLLTHKLKAVFIFAACTVFTACFRYGTMCSIRKADVLCPHKPTCCSAAPRISVSVSMSLVCMDVQLIAADGLSKLRLKSYPCQQQKCCSGSLRAELFLHTGRRLHAPCAELKRLELAAARTDHATAEGCQGPLYTPPKSTLKKLPKTF